MSTARQEHAAALLPDGRVLVIGGRDENLTILASAELYDPVANSWSAAADMATTRFNHTSTTLSSGKVLVVGGTTDTCYVDNGVERCISTNQTELYDPATNSWSRAAPMSLGRTQHATIDLGDGTLLIPGRARAALTDVFPCAIRTIALPYLDISCTIARIDSITCTKLVQPSWLPV